MIATLLLGAATAFGLTFNNDSVIINPSGCEIVHYPVRQTWTAEGSWGDQTRCCTSEDFTLDGCYGGGDVCAVADESYRCCAAHGASYYAIHCHAVPESQCVPDPNDPMIPKWCPSPSPPAEPAGTNSATTGGIGVGSLLGVTLVGGVLASIRAP